MKSLNYLYPRFNKTPAKREKLDEDGTWKPSESASRSIMLKTTTTWTASSMALSLTPASLGAERSSESKSRGASVSFSTKPRVARSFSLMGALRQSSRTNLVISSPRAFDATAPWACVQNEQEFFLDTNAAINSRSPTDHSDGPRITS